MRCGPESRLACRHHGRKFDDAAEAAAGSVMNTELDGLEAQTAGVCCLHPPIPAAEL